MTYLHYRHIVQKNLVRFSHNWPDIYLNVLPEYWTLDKYRATIGHKVNHSFKSSNAEFGRALHPRFGLILTIVASENIQKGQPILINYAYSERSIVPHWYEKAYKEEYGKPWPGTNIYDETNNVDINNKRSTTNRGSS